MYGVKIGHPAPNLLGIESGSRPEPVAGDLPASCALVDPPPGHAEQAAQLGNGQEMFSGKTVLATLVERRDQVRPPPGNARAVHRSHSLRSEKPEFPELSPIADPRSEKIASAAVELLNHSVGCTA